MVTATLTLEPGSGYLVDGSTHSATATANNLPMMRFEYATAALSPFYPVGSAVIQDAGGSAFQGWAVNYSITPAAVNGAANGYDFDNYGSGSGWGPLSGVAYTHHDDGGNTNYAGIIEFYELNHMQNVTKTFTLTMLPGLGYTVDPNHNTEVVTVQEDTDNDGVPNAVELSSAAAVAGDNVVFTLTPSSTMPTAGTDVTLTLSDGTADNGFDYTFPTTSDYWVYPRQARPD